MTKEEKLKQIWDDIHAAEKVLETELAPRWNTILQQARGEYVIVQDQYGHGFSVDVVEALSSLIVPSIYFRDPRILCNPTRPQDERRCKITETIINYWIRELGLKKQAERCVLDAFLFGEAYMKLGYNPSLDRILEPITDNLGQPLDTGEKVDPVTGETRPGEPLLRDSKGNVWVERGGRFVQIMDKDGDIPPLGQEMIEINEYMRRGQLYAVRWEPWNFLRDPEAKYVDCSDSTWVAFRAVLPLKQVKGNPRYKNTSTLKGTQIAPSAIERSMYKIFPMFRTHVPEELDRVELYEVWRKEWNDDLKRWDMWLYVMVKGHDKFLLEEKSPWLAEGFPVQVLAFREDPGNSHPQSIIEKVQPQINTMNLARTQFANFRERFRSKYIANSTVIDEADALNVIQGKEELAMVTVDEGVDLATVMKGLDIPELNPAILGDYDLALREIRIVSGITEDMLGGAGPGRQATQASYIQGAANVRLQHKQDRIGEFVKGIAKYWKQLLQQFGDYQMAVRIEGTVQEQEWAEITVAEEIPDDIAFDVDVYPSAFQSKEAQLQSAMSMYNLLRQDPLIQPEKLINKVLKAFGESAPEAFIMPPQPPQIDPATGQPIDPNAHGGAAKAGAIDQNELRQATRAQNPNNTLSGENV